ncbi:MULTISPECIES: hypothetical protein [Streptomyces]|uniref:Integral membrane protein n=1 Tax=Streptomyces coelicolor (strain ATCC BAA-471 / A3(2) / M145) TaxID=100226 RepID=O86746_STRCO|nr:MULTISPECIES: hypothetical protein [Streptomyces]MYU45173.1 hypothetical protein [Streptomyces sp. SID7813]MDX2930170.1 hypothetical protein [Streptomyces sp. NRRL_B-16638]NSL84122.1 hypothetical protein [Streptomyces coelicolor]QFI45511.1 hypothetical protein FQ762_29210 [Streptomyces coelicolor A3(2)]QKN69104.1 hypothetical protein HCU77_28650 [Streptomyces coelicolor]
MLALRLTRTAHLAVHLRRLLVALASAGTGFLLLCALGHALSHPDAPGASALRLAWCAAPLAAAVYLAVAVARTDPGTRPRSGLSAIGLGPGRLMAVSATTTALSAALGSVAALLAFLYLRGSLTGRPPSDRVAADALAVGQSLPAPAVLTLLVLVPALASASVAHTLRPRDPRPAAAAAPRGYGRFGAYGWGKARETFGAYGRFGARLAVTAGSRAAAGPAGSRAAGAARVGAGGALLTQASDPHPPAPTDGTTQTLDAAPPAPAPAPTDATSQTPDATPAAHPEPTPRPQNTTALPWGIAVLTAGLTVETYTGNAAGAPAPGTAPSAGVLIGWALTALGLALAGPGLTHLCGRLLQAARPGALRLLAGRVLMEEAQRVGRPLGVVAAVAAAAYVATTVYDGDGPAFGPLTTLGALLVAGCTVATLLTAAVEARDARADTTDALLRLGAPPATLRAAAAVRAAALLVLFGPLVLIVAVLAALPLDH